MMKLEEAYKQKLSSMNQKIAQSLLKELQDTACELLQKTQLSVYRGPVAIKLYQGIRENVVKELRHSEDTIQQIIAYENELKKSKEDEAEYSKVLKPELT